MRYIALLVAGVALVGCGEDPVRPGNECALMDLPLAETAAGPVVTDVGLEVQDHGIVVVATATDPQGGANLADVQQRIGVFPDERCEGEPIFIEDDLVDSGVEETFGTVVESATSPGLYQAIAAASGWPVSLEFRDLDGNVTSGRVLARVIR